MAKLCLKKQSKRVTCSMRYKIEKRIRDHNKKLRKEAKKKENKVNRKPITVPNICPFKDQILAEVETLKAAQLAEKEKRRQELREERMSQRESTLAGGLQGLVNSAQARQEQHEGENDGGGSIGPGLFTDTTARTFFKEFKKVVNAADVILEVLDARDPLGTRCMTVEKEVTRLPGKRLVIVLNKADLVPRDVLEGWLKYIRRSFPAVPFKASTQQQKKGLGRQGGRKGKMAANLSQNELEGSPCVGAELLMSLLGNYCRNKDIKTAITVGVVGLPNVGKSSLINSLKRSRACNVGALPGITKSMQQVQLDTRLKLLDSPGIVFAAGDMSDVSIALKNALRLDHLQDVFGPASAILQRANQNQLKEIYKIEDNYNNPDEFLALLAKSMGRFKKGGIPDSRAAARCLIQDWNMGKIKYYVQPPEENTAEVHVSAEIVSEHAKEFDLSELTKLEKSALGDLSKEAPEEGMMIESDGPVVPLVDHKIQGDAEVMEEAEEAAVDTEQLTEKIQGELLSHRLEIVGKRRHRKKGGLEKKSKKDDPTMSLEGNLKIGKIKKMEFKKMKKDLKRQGKRLAHTLKKVTISKDA